VNLFTYLPPDGLHALAYLDRQLVEHAVVTTRWLQPLGVPVLRTAYVDAVAVSPSHLCRGIGSAVMRHLAAAIHDYDIAGLETERVAFYQRLGWEAWCGPLAGRSAQGLIPTPDQRDVMILRLPRTPELDCSAECPCGSPPSSWPRRSWRWPSGPSRRRSRGTTRGAGCRICSSAWPSSPAAS